MEETKNKGSKGITSKEDLGDSIYRLGDESEIQKLRNEISVRLEILERRITRLEELR